MEASVRVSNNMVMRSAMEAVQRTNAKVEEARGRVASGLRVSRPSDDPVGSAKILETSSRLSATRQHARNIERGRARLAAEERVLDGLTNLLTRAAEISMQQGSANADANSRQVAAIEVRGLIDTAISLGNTRFGDTYLFGGMHATAQPFNTAGTTSATAPPAGGHMVEIATGAQAQTNHDGMEIFVNSGVISALQSLETALSSGSAVQINSVSPSVSASLDTVGAMLGEVGVRDLVLGDTLTRAENLELELTQARSDLQDVELDEAITQLLQHESALEAALLSVARIERTSLVDIL